MKRNASHTLATGLLLALSVTGCQRGDDQPDPALAAASFADAPGTIWFAAEIDGATRLYSMSPASLARAVASPDGVAYYPAPGARDIAIAVEDDGTGESHREQLAVRAADGAWRRVGPIAPSIRNPSAAPDGSWLAFESDAESFRDIYRVDIDTGRTTRLTRDGDGAFDPDVAPDGRRIAFVSTTSGEPQVHAMDRDGGNRALLVDAPGQEHTPRWSPDGSAIAFAGDRDGPERLFVLDAHTGEVARATALDRADRHEGDPVWSPDGSKLAYVVHFATGPRELWVVSRDSSAPVRVSAPEAHVVSASWSPDGAYLAYDQHTTAGRFIEIARADGTARTRVDIDGDAWLPRWR